MKTGKQLPPGHDTDFWGQAAFTDIAPLKPSIFYRIAVGLHLRWLTATFDFQFEAVYYARRDLPFNLLTKKEKSTLVLETQRTSLTSNSSKKAWADRKANKAAPAPAPTALSEKAAKAKSLVNKIFARSASRTTCLSPLRVGSPTPSLTFSAHSRRAGKKTLDDEDDSKPNKKLKK